jgi:hypothetical protein
MFAAGRTVAALAELFEADADFELVVLDVDGFAAADFEAAAFGFAFVVLDLVFAFDAVFGFVLEREELVFFSAMPAS